MWHARTRWLFWLAAGLALALCLLIPAWARGRAALTGPVLTGAGYDGVGAPLPVAVSSEPPLSLFERVPGTSRYNAYFPTTGAYTVTWRTDARSLPATPLTLTGDRRLDVYLTGGHEAVTDGGFEAGPLWDAWEVIGPATRTAASRHTGLNGVQMTGGTGPRASISQQITVPDGADTPVLSFMYRLHAATPAPYELSVRVADDVAVTTIVSILTPAEDWTHAWADLSAWAGQRVTLSFVLSQPWFVAAWAELDEISVADAAVRGRRAFLPGVMR